jgi:IS5 family transposase
MRQLGVLHDVADETPILNFRRFLHTHRLAEKLFTQVNAHLRRKRLSLCSGTIVDATIFPRAEFDEERRRRARSVDAPSEEG